MLAIASLISAIVPMVSFLWFIWLLDRYDREPLGLLAANFLWGAFGAVVLGVAFALFMQSFLGADDFTGAVFIAPLVEEPAKAIFLLFTVRHRKFDNVTDGVVYGAAIGLGFGMTENFLYFLGAATPEQWVVMVVIRTFFTAVMHAMATAISGAFVGVTKFEYRPMRWPLRFLGLILAMSMHGFWNFSVSIGDGIAVGMGVLFIILSVIVFFVLFQLSLAYEKKLIKRELTAEAERGYVPLPYLPYLTFAKPHGSYKWLEQGVNGRKFVQTSTRLAFRVSQVNNCRERERAAYESEIAELRVTLNRMVNPAWVDPALAPAALPDGLPEQNLSLSPPSAMEDVQNPSNS